MPCLLLGFQCFFLELACCFGVPFASFLDLPQLSFLVVGGVAPILAPGNPAWHHNKGMEVPYPNTGEMDFHMQENVGN